MLKNITKLSGNIVKNKWYQWVAIILSYTYIIIYYVNNLTKTIDSMVKICYHYAVFSYKGFFISSEKTPTSISGEWRINIIKPRRSWIYAMLENFGNMTHNIENNLELPVRTKMELKMMEQVIPIVSRHMLLSYMWKIIEYEIAFIRIK